MTRPYQTNRPELRKFLLGFACIVLAICGSGRLFASERPNIIIIFTDDMGYSDVGCYGGKFGPTPNIDQLAKEGTRFTQFYVASPICSPSRTGLLTGMYPARWKIHTFLQTQRGNRAAGQADYLDPKAPSMARALKEAGYATAHIGKWHLGGGRDVTVAPPFSAYGYDEHVSTYESPQPDPNITAKDWIWSPEDKVKRWDRSGYFVDKTLDFLSRKKGQPCFVNFWPDDVHTPWVTKDAESEGKQKQQSPAELKQVLAEYDRQVGRLMNGLKKLGIDKDTIVIFSSDNGPGPNFPNNTRTLGMRGQKGSLYEGGIRVPFIVRWPAKTPANRVDEKSVINAVDLFPSLCKVAGATVPPTANLDGEDLSKVFFGETAARKKPTYWSFDRKGNGEPKNPNISPDLAIRDGQWKLLVNTDGSGVELFNLEADPNEVQNVTNQYPNISKSLADAALKWKRSLP